MTNAKVLFTEAEVAGMRERWEQTERDRGFAAELGKLQGQLATLPAQMELVSRKVALEVLAEQKKERIESGQRRWLRADQVSVVLQLVVTAIVAYIAIKR